MPEQNTTAAEAVASFAQVRRRAYEEVAAAITAIPDPEKALEHANDFFKEAEALYQEAAELRTETVGRIWEADELSLTALADRIGITRQRAGQIAKAYQKGKEAPCTT